MSPLDAARDTLPWWVLVAPAVVRLTLVLALVLGSTLMAGGLAMRAMDQLDVRAELHWTERARQLFPWRVALTTWPLLTAVILAGLAYLVGPLARPSAAVIALLSLVLGIFVSMPVRLRVEQRARGLRGPFLPALGSTWLWSFARLPHLWALVVLVLLAPARLDRVTWSLLAIAVGVMLLPAAGLHLAPGRWLGFVRPASPRLVALMAEASQRTGVPVRAVIELRTSIANALAFPTTGMVAFTTGALESLDDAQIVAVATHELGHLKEPLALRVLRGASPLALVPLVLVRPLLATQRYELLLVVLLGVVAWLYGVRFAIRNTEKHADAVAHTSGGEAGTYAAALETLYRVNLVPAVLRTRRTAHPHLYDRLVAAGVQPPYARPAPPPLLSFIGRIPGVLALLAALGLTLVIGIATGAFPDRPLVAIALSGGDADRLLALADDAPDATREILYARAAVAADPRSRNAHHVLVTALAAAAHCRAAQRALAQWARADRSAPHTDDWRDAMSAVMQCDR